MRAAYALTNLLTDSSHVQSTIVGANKSSGKEMPIRCLDTGMSAVVVVVIRAVVDDVIVVVDAAAHPKTPCLPPLGRACLARQISKK